MRVNNLTGIITSEDDIVYLLQSSIEKLIPKKRRALLTINENSYPIKIKISK